MFYRRQTGSVLPASGCHHIQGVAEVFSHWLRSLTLWKDFSCNLDSECSDGNKALLIDTSMSTLDRLEDICQHFLCFHFALKPKMRHTQKTNTHTHNFLLSEEKAPPSSPHIHTYTQFPFKCVFVCLFVFLTASHLF